MGARIVRKPGVVYGSGEVVNHSGYRMLAVRQPDISMLEKLGIIGSRVVVSFETPNGIVSFTARAVREGRVVYFYIPKRLWPSFEDLHHYTGLMMIEVRGGEP